MLTSRLRTKTITLVTVLIMTVSSIQPVFAVGSNDNFSAATPINSLPFSGSADTIGATSEPGEPYPYCYNSGYAPNSVWFAYTPPSNVTLTARSNYYSAVVAIYTGSSVDSLSAAACGTYSPQTTFQAQGGTTYYIRLSTQYGGVFGEAAVLPFTLDVTPPPQANFYYYPSDPSAFDTVSFCDNSYDPGGYGIQSVTWNFGDGTTSATNCALHKYATDGDYTIQHTVTTPDGRTGAISQVVQVRTRDVAISSFSIPQTARTNQTKVISVDIKNKNYSDYVQVTLSKGVPGGGEQPIGTLTIYVPARATKPTTFKFSYTFTSDDAKIGKVTFKAVATLVNGRDALPADNTAIGTTLVNGGTTSYP